MILPFQIYRHFKGGIYIVLSVALSEASLEPTVVYMSLNGDSKVWTRSQADFMSLVPEEKENPTGQKHRFELVKDIRHTLNECSTENLVKELKKRPDSPLNEIDVDGLNDQVKLREYIVGEIRVNNEFDESFLQTVVAVDSLEEARAFMAKHPDRCSSRTKIYKSVIVEVESFD